MHALISIEALTPDRWPAVRSIYAQGVATGNATFEQAIPDWAEWDERHLQACRIVAKAGDRIVGWAALSAVSKRHVYRGVAEVSVYVAEDARGHGTGAKLLSRLIHDSEAQDPRHEGFWTLQAGIFPENIASIKLHTNAGFRIVGTRARLGCMHGIWRDVLLMERRSPIVGT